MGKFIGFPEISVPAMAWMGKMAIRALEAEIRELEAKLAAL